ncbi:bet1-like protein At4g14600 isoform X2 [Nicotiana tabacum]|uniref:Bet1-like protein At4g14600 isoform X2 n=1 Tax=Nicotiana tabacum TaxID=4097 RepID=A0A1S3XGD2_TOBAC|nr:PREDICTED: bet1-like protein At4g14600 isoform X2 [Nicotiana tabacum]
MASISHRGGDFYGAASHRSRDGLSTRQVGGSDEIQVRIDPMHGDLDNEITGLRKQVKQLRNSTANVVFLISRLSGEYIDAWTHANTEKLQMAPKDMASVMLLCLQFKLDSMCA